MRTGFCGTFVISWSQTELNGLGAAPPSELRVGTTWRWSGAPLRVDGPVSVLQLDRSDDDVHLRTRAARMVRRLIGLAFDEAPPPDTPRAETGDAPLSDQYFIVTDGRRSHVVTLVPVTGAARPLLMFLDDMPPPDTDLWIVRHALQPGLARKVAPQGAGGGVICFTAGTRIDTPSGPRAVEALRAGDLVETRDSGPQRIAWTGARRMSGARLFALPGLRPIRIGSGAFGVDRPDDALLVSPDHRLLLRGPAAQALFNTPEVLVAARDLINGDTVRVDMQAREVTYVHLMLARHEILFANGLEAESFHPASTELRALDPDDRERLLQLMPQIAEDPQTYGAPARRCLSSSEAAILMHRVA